MTTSGTTTGLPSYISSTLVTQSGSASSASWAAAVAIFEALQLVSQAEYKLQGETVLVEGQEAESSAAQVLKEGKAQSAATFDQAMGSMTGAVGAGIALGATGAAYAASHTDLAETTDTQQQLDANETQLNAPGTNSTNEVIQAGGLGNGDKVGDILPADLQGQVHLQPTPAQNALVVKNAAKVQYARGGDLESYTDYQRRTQPSADPLSEGNFQEAQRAGEVAAAKQQLEDQGYTTGNITPEARNAAIADMKTAGTPLLGPPAGAAVTPEQTAQYNANQALYADSRAGANSDGYVQYGKNGTIDPPALAEAANLLRSGQAIQPAQAPTANVEEAAKVQIQAEKDLNATPPKNLIAYEGYTASKAPPGQTLLSKFDYNEAQMAGQVHVAEEQLMNKGYTDPSISSEARNAAISKIATDPAPNPLSPTPKTKMQNAINQSKGTVAQKQRSIEEKRTQRVQIAQMVEQLIAGIGNAVTQTLMSQQQKLQYEAQAQSALDKAVQDMFTSMSSTFGQQASSANQTADQAIANWQQIANMQNPA